MIGSLSSRRLQYLKQNCYISYGEIKSEEIFCPLSAYWRGRNQVKSLFVVIGTEILPLHPLFFFKFAYMIKDFYSEL